MKLILFSIAIFSTLTSLAQNPKDTTKFVTVSPSLKIRRSDEVKAYADSINNYIKGTPLPNFLLDECFEIDNLLWKSFHPSSSVRWEILLKVTNKPALKVIMQTFSERLKQKCSYERIHAYKISIPTAEQSFYQLMRKRYKQL